MDTTAIEKNIELLERKAKQYISVEKLSNKPLFLEHRNFSNFIIQNKLYISVYLIVFILLYVYKPSIIMSKLEIDNPRYIIYKKLLLWWLFLGTLINIGIKFQLSRK